MSDRQKYKEYILKKLKDREWRLDNLYFIIDKDGKKVRFRRKLAQLQLWKNIWYRNVILKGRQIGFSTFIAIIILDRCLFHPNTTCGIIDYNIDDAKKKLAKIKYAYENLPDFIKEMCPLKTERKEELEFENGSGIVVGVSHRGGTLQILHVSEYGKISAKYPEKATEIQTGGFETIGKNSLIFVESTAEGTGGKFHDMVQSSQDQTRTKVKRTQLDFKDHFFPWFAEPEYRLNALVIIPAEIEEYFKELQAKYGTVLDQQQKNWYTTKLKNFGWNRELMFREYPSIPEEAFWVSLEGAYFKQQMSKMRLDGRICTKLFNSAQPVNTFWDIGVNDETAIWFHQTDGVRHRLIHYYENSGEGISHYVNQLKKLHEERGFVYGQHFGPHDLENRDWANEAVKRVAVAKQLGVKFRIVPRVKIKMDAIEASRNFLNMTWIDNEYCERGIQCLDNYKKEWDEKRSTWRDQPLHNWASNGADALQCGAVGYKPSSIPSQGGRYPGRARNNTSRSAWTS